jgi:hypothetical protein
MAMTIINLDSIGSGFRIAPLSSKDYYVLQDITVSSADGNAIVNQNAIDVRMTVAGTVSGVGYDVALGNEATFGNELTVTTTGIIRGQSFGVFLGGDAQSFVNHGEVSGWTFALIFDMDEAVDQASFKNTGTLLGGLAGITNNMVAREGVFTLVNTDLIWGGSFSYRDTRLRTHSQNNTMAARGQADRKMSARLSKRMAIVRQSFRRPNMFSIL